MLELGDYNVVEDKDGKERIGSGQYITLTRVHREGEHGQPHSGPVVSAETNSTLEEASKDKIVYGTSDVLTFKWDPELNEWSLYPLRVLPEFIIYVSSLDDDVDVIWSDEVEDSYRELYADRKYVKTDVIDEIDEEGEWNEEDDSDAGEVQEQDI